MTSFAERALDELPATLIERFAPPVVLDEPKTVVELCRAALAAPIGAPPLGEVASRAERVAIVVNDASRDEPRSEMLAAIREVVPWHKVTLLVAAGTHTADSSVVPEAFRDAPIIVHDASRLDAMVDLGTTSRGTRVRIAKDLSEFDAVVVTGRIRPHYFAGFSGGLKSIFPGFGYAEDILQNHLLKADPSARLGIVEENACRADMEEAASRLRSSVFLLSFVADADGNAVSARAGDPVRAHRALVELARPLFTVRAPRARVVVVADRPPVTDTLYQASKLLPPAGAILEDGGIAIVVADCARGTGPLERVNRGIYELGVKPQLPASHRIVLVSELLPEVTRRTYAIPADTLGRALAESLESTGSERAVVLWRAGECIVEARTSA